MELLLACALILVPLLLVYLIVRRARGHHAAIAAVLMTFGIAFMAWGAVWLVRAPALQPAGQILIGLSIAVSGWFAWRRHQAFRRRRLLVKV